MKKPHDAKSQAGRILSWLKQGRKITPIQALEKWGCFRLGARINDLRNEGYHIITRNVKRNGKRFAEYSL